MPRNRCQSLTRCRISTSYPLCYVQFATHSPRRAVCHAVADRDTPPPPPPPHSHTVACTSTHANAPASTRADRQLEFHLATLLRRHGRVHNARDAGGAAAGRLCGVGEGRLGAERLISNAPPQGHRHEQCTAPGPARMPRSTPQGLGRCARRGSRPRGLIDHNVSTNFGPCPVLLVTRRSAMNRRTSPLLQISSCVVSAHLCCP